MTHDQLAKRLKEGQWVDKDEMHLRSNALRAVVELHKPVEYEYFDNPVCAACSPDIDIWFDYPCKTIKAIEKELG